MQQYRSGNRFFMKNITNRDEFMEKFFLLITNALQSFTGNHYSKHYKSEKLLELKLLLNSTIFLKLLRISILCSERAMPNWLNLRIYIPIYTCDILFGKYSPKNIS